MKSTRSYGKKIYLSSKETNFHHIMELAAIEMTRPPPKWVKQTVLYPKKHRGRNIQQIRDLFICMLQGPNIPEFVPGIIYSYVKYYQKHNHNSNAQLTVMEQIYRQLCWEEVIRDKRFSLITLEDLQSGDY